jgi:hypothetical protein
MSLGDVVLYRDVLARAYDAFRAQHDDPADPFYDPSRADDFGDVFCSHWEMLGRDLPLYYVTRDMTVVAVAAAATMPAQPLLVSDLPSPTGLCVWADPIGHAPDDDGGDAIPMTAASWSLYDVRYCCELCEQFEEGTPAWDAHWSLPHREGRDVDVMLYVPTPYWHGVMPVAHMTWSIGARPDPAWTVDNLADCDDEDAARCVRATWALMAQSLARIETRAADRGTRRREIRAGRAPTPIVVVMLRRYDAHYGEGDERDVHWSHRWIVSGHWRNQYLPTVRAHRLQWIAPYVKGPEDRPLIVKERVTVLGR